MARYSAPRSIGPRVWIQPLFMPGVTRFSSSNESSPFTCSQRSPVLGSKSNPEAVANAVGEDLLDVRSHLATDPGAHGKERVVEGRGAVVIEAHDDAGEVRIVRFRPAELIVPLSGPDRPVCQILHMHPADRVP